MTKRDAKALVRASALLCFNAETNAKLNKKDTTECFRLADKLLAIAAKVQP